MVGNLRVWNTTGCLFFRGSSSLSFVWVPGSPPPEIEEHSLAKLSVFRNYLSSYIDCLCSGFLREEFKLDLVDGFSGGGLFLNEGKEVSGTPLIMLEEADAACARLNADRIKPIRFDMKFHFVDIEPEHTRYLSQVLDERNFNVPRYQVRVYEDAFEDVVDVIIADIKRRQPRAGRALFLLDQKGFSQVELDLVRRIFNELAHAEVILTFAADDLIDRLADRPQMYAAVRPIELEAVDIRDLIELKHGDGGKALVQRVLRDHIRTGTGATYDTPFFIRPEKSRKALWFVHLSRHPVARDVMVQCHWNNFNTFEHYGSGGLDMMGWDPLGSGLLPLFGFSQFDADLLYQQLVETIPSEMSSLHLSSPLPVGDFRAAVANRTAARSSDLDRALSALASAGEFDIQTKDGKVRQKGLTRINSSDRIALPFRPMFPGWSKLGL